ncbi:MAG: hypothetical protein QXT99_09750 [Candidatus Nitrosotenuis sp.]
MNGLNVRIGSKDVSGYCYYMPSKAKEEEGRDEAVVVKIRKNAVSQRVNRMGR